MIRIETTQIKNYEFSEVARDGVKIGNVFQSAGRGKFKAGIVVDKIDIYVEAFGFADTKTEAVKDDLLCHHYATGLDEFSEMMTEEIVE